jgi:hypothetical protein
MVMDALPWRLGDKLLLAVLLGLFGCELVSPPVVEQFEMGQQ